MALTHESDIRKQARDVHCRKWRIRASSASVHKRPWSLVTRTSCAMRRRSNSQRNWASIARRWIAPKVCCCVVEASVCINRLSESARRPWITARWSSRGAFSRARVKWPEACTLLVDVVYHIFMFLRVVNSCKCPHAGAQQAPDALLAPLQQMLQ